MFQHVFSNCFEVGKLPDLGVLQGQVFFRVPGGRSKALQPSIPGESVDLEKGSKVCPGKTITPPCTKSQPAPSLLDPLAITLVDYNTTSQSSMIMKICIMEIYVEIILIYIL